MASSGLLPSGGPSGVPASRLRPSAVERGGQTPLAPGAVTGASGVLDRWGCGPSLRSNQREAEIPRDFRVRMLVRVDKGKYRGAPNDCGVFFFFSFLKLLDPNKDTP